MNLLDKILGGRTVDEALSDKSAEELVSFVKSKAEEARQYSARVSHEAVWLTNTAALMGFTQVYYNTTTRKFETLGSAQPNNVKSRIHVNKILPTIQNRTARLCKNKPKYDIKPNSNETEDKEASRLGLQILENTWEKQQLEKKRAELIMWAQQASHAYLKVSYDESLGDPMIDPMTGECVGYEGDIQVDVTSGFEVFPDPLAKSFEESQWFVLARVRKLDYFRLHWGEKGQKVKEDVSYLLSNQYESRINSLNSLSRGTSGTNTQLKNVATEYTYYEKRSKNYPMGRMIVVASNELLEDKGLPVGEIPLVKFDDVTIGGKYYGEAVITHMRPIQEQFNRLYQKRQQWVSLLLSGKYLVPRGSQLTKESLDDQSGEVVEYTPVVNGGEPKVMEVPNIPQYAYKEEESLQAQLDDISGINEVSRGSLPSAQIPAIGMQFLTEQDDTRIGLEVTNHEEGYARLGKLILMYAQKFYVKERLLKVGGQGLEYTIKSFKGSDLKGNTDVIVIKGSSLPGSKVLKRQEVLNLYTQGLLGDPADPKVREKVLQLLEFGNVSEVWQDYALDMKQVKEQIEMIERGEIPEIDEQDNHGLHLQELNRYRKTDKFKKLMPEQQEVFYAVREEHLQFAMNLSDPSLQFEEEKQAIEEQGQAEVIQAQEMDKQTDEQMNELNNPGVPLNA